MKNYNTEAINLKSYKLGETDKIIVLYSKEYGIVRAVAKGCRKTTSKIGGRGDLLVANKLNISKGKNLDVICQAESIDSFKEIRKDINKLSYAMYVAELINVFGVENDSNSSEVYKVLFECLKNIAIAKNNLETLWSVIRFQQKLMRLVGYQVELNTCVKCNNHNDIKQSGMDYRTVATDIKAFSPELGGVICSRCKSSLYKSKEITLPVIRTLKDSLNFDFPDESTNEAILILCFNLLKEFISNRTHKKLKTEDFIDCLC